jgi:hypothetical protein
MQFPEMGPFFNSLVTILGRICLPDLHFGFHARLIRIPEPVVA